MVFSASACASRGLPAKSKRRTSGKFFSASGLLRSRFSPAQTVSSLSWICSVSTLPKTMPPSRPLPIGLASIHLLAGCRYQKTMEGEEGLISVVLLSLGAAEKDRVVQIRKAVASFRSIQVLRVNTNSYILNRVECRYAVYLLKPHGAFLRFRFGAKAGYLLRAFWNRFRSDRRPVERSHA